MNPGHSMAPQTPQRLYFETKQKRISTPFIGCRHLGGGLVAPALPRPREIEPKQLHVQPRKLGQKVRREGREGSGEASGLAKSRDSSLLPFPAAAL